uniref:Uncharacterized protein n=1 Tax=Leersia perrieri TaxID=77586 RepID=A0A0D9XHC2_9ORYZ
MVFGKGDYRLYMRNIASVTAHMRSRSQVAYEKIAAMILHGNRSGDGVHTRSRVQVLYKGSIASATAVHTR